MMGAGNQAHHHPGSFDLRKASVRNPTHETPPAHKEGRENKDVAASCQAMATNLDIKIEEKYNRELSLESPSHKLSEAFDKLNTIGAEGPG
jgi:hypothetical protein